MNKFKKEFIFILASVILIIASVLIEVRMTSFKSITLSSKIIIYAYINLTVILFLLMLFLVTRNIIKLIIERKMKVVGARLRTKLVSLFAIVSLIPSLFILAIILLSGFAANIVNKWYAPRIKKAVQYAAQVGNYYNNAPAAHNPEVSHKVNWLINFYDSYSRMGFVKNPVETTYFIFFAIFTLMILFVSSWVGFYLSKKIIAPIIDLVKGTKMVSSGHLDVKIPGNSDDEIGTLVNSFNEMTMDLKRNKDVIEKANLDLKTINEEIEKRRRYMEIILKNINAGVIALDSTGKIRNINKKVEDMFGLMPGDVLNRHYRDVFNKSSFSDIRTLIKELSRENRENITRELKIYVAGEAKEFLVSLTILKDDSNNKIGFIIVMNDTTDIMKAQRVAAWEEVAKRMAHEIKNPLTPIKLSAERLKKKFRGKLKGDEDSVFNEAIDTIIKEVDDLKNIVDEFSLYARLPRANFEYSDVNSLLTEAVSLYSNAHRDIEFKVDLDRGMPPLYIDRHQMKRAFMNLIDNAVYSIILKNTGRTGAGSNGKISVASKNLEEGRGGVITISDNGTGLSEEVVQNIYEPYFSTKQGGTGLGLAITKNIISENNADIRAENNEEGGATFTISVKTMAGA